MSDREIHSLVAICTENALWTFPKFSTIVLGVVCPSAPSGHATVFLPHFLYNTTQSVYGWNVFHLPKNHSRKLSKVFIQKLGKYAKRRSHRDMYKAETILSINLIKISHARRWFSRQIIILCTRRWRVKQLASLH